jgi:hypothetical protein
VVDDKVPDRLISEFLRFAPATHNSTIAMYSPITPHSVAYNPEQKAHYQRFGPSVPGFIPHPALDWLQSIKFG